MRNTNTPERRATQGSLEILNTPDQILQELLESREQAPLQSIKDMMAFGRVMIEEATSPCLETEPSATEREEICLRKIKELEFNRSCLRSEIKDLHEAVEGRALELAECRDESLKQSRLVEKLQNLVSDYSEKLRSTRSELLEAQRGNTAEVREWREQVRALETEVIRGKNSLKSALEMVEDRQGRIDELVAELEECSPRAKLLDIQLNDANGEIRQLEEDLRDASRKLEGLQRDSQEYEINCEREIAKLEYDVRVERKGTRGA
ncbi:hypothetical protein FRC05_003382 [Tulasnella sp. 425]|nr:hypothetical protein FRC05_003382 [Tulasnella sp. 425]